MVNYKAMIVNILWCACGVAAVSFMALGFLHSADAKYVPSAATIEMSKDIRTAQEFVQQYETKVNDAKTKARVYRDTICKIEKSACTKEWLDPLNVGTDLSPFLLPTNPS